MQGEHPQLDLLNVTVSGTARQTLPIDAENALPPDLLASEVKTISRAHRKCQGTAQRNREQARVAGEALLRLKALVPHGQWLHFLRKIFRGAPSLRMAQKYMLLAEGWEVLAAKSNCSSFLTLDEACRLIAKDRQAKADREPLVFSADPATLALERLAEAVLGEVDLDPCTTVGDCVVPAKHSFSAADGLSQAWRGRVFLSPPQGRELPKWIAKLTEEHRRHVHEALVLVAARTDTRVFHDLAAIAACLAFLRSSVDGERKGSPKLLAYLGDRVATFVEAVEDHATVLFSRP